MVIHNGKCLVSAQDILFAAKAVAMYMHEEGHARSEVMSILDSYSIMIDEIVAHNGIPRGYAEEWEKAAIALRRRETLLEIIRFSGGTEEELS